MDRMLRTAVSLVLVPLILAACSGTEQASSSSTVEVVNTETETSFTVEIIGSVIPWVEFYLDDETAPRFRDEEAPFRYAQEYDGLTAGTHTIRAVIAIDLLNVVSTVTRSIEFEVPISEPSEPPEAVETSSFTLIDAVTNLPIGEFDPLLDGATIDLAAIATSELNIVFKTDDPEVDSVQFTLNGSAVRVENNAPWALAGDSNGKFKAWTPAVGSYTLTATPFIGSGANGETGTAETIAFEVVDGLADDPIDPSEPPTEPVEPTPVDDALPRVVSGYYWMTYIGKIDSWQRIGTDEYIASAASNGWDLWDLPDDGSPTVYEREDWAHFRLARDATVGVAWMDERGPDAWLSDWTPAGEVTVKGEIGQLYTKVLSAGWHSLPSFNIRPAGRIYELLFAEADGKATPYPAAPDGLEQPVPNQYCPDWVHDRHTAPDFRGIERATWHPQVDPVYGCYFGHEHGSDPSWVDPDYEPAFDVYAHVAGNGEAHEGFKVMTFQGDNESRWALVIHWTSGLDMRKCVRFHAYEAYAVDAAGNTVVDILGKGDTGGLSNSTTGDRVAPDDCPDVNEDLNSFAIKNIPQYPDTGYESWQIHFGDALPDVGRIFHATTAPALLCADSNCDAMMANANPDRMGTQRWSNTYSEYGSYFGFDGGAKGRTFCTDYKGSTELSCDSPASVPQFVAPGQHTVSDQGSRFYPLDPWTGLLLGSDLDPDNKTNDTLTAPMNVGERVVGIN